MATPSPWTLVIALFPHLISAGTIPADLLDRAMQEPLAGGRDEVIYLICTHRRIALGGREDVAGWRNVYLAEGGIGAPFTYDLKTAWAYVRFPERVQPSALGWAVLDPKLEELEGLVPDASFDPARDPDGAAGRHRQELLGWVFDRHIELNDPSSVDRGEVLGGEILFRVEYIGKAQAGALWRAAGAHHKMPLILQRTLLYTPHRLVYVLPCDIRVARYDPANGDASVSMLPLSQGEVATALSRDTLIAAAEEALIAVLGAPENERNAARRTFPRSSAGDQLRVADVRELIIGFYGLPGRVALQGQRLRVTRQTKAIRLALSQHERGHVPISAIARQPHATRLLSDYVRILGDRLRRQSSSARAC